MEKLSPKKLTKKGSGIMIHIPLPMKTTEVYDSYWRFAALRQEAFFNRLGGKSYPWSADSIINKHRFTNAYRASDRVSQYLIKNVIYNQELPQTPLEVLFRILLFKLFNKIETWELLSSRIGLLTYEKYNFEDYDSLLNTVITSGKTIYSAAYIMPSGKSYYGHTRKHSNHLKLIEHILENGTHTKLMSVTRMQDAFEIIKGFPSLGDFLAFQLLIGINYSTIINFPESDFVVPGPGAKGGISKCFQDTGGLTNVEIIKLMSDRQEREFERLGPSFQTLWGRRLQLIDCQNLFCEVDKYARVRHPEIKGNSDRVRIKQSFKSSSKPLDIWFPPKWGINEKIDGVIQSDLFTKF